MPHGCEKNEVCVCVNGGEMNRLQLPKPNKSTSSSSSLAGAAADTASATTAATGAGVTTACLTEPRFAARLSTNTKANEHINDECRGRDLKERKNR